MDNYKIGRIVPLTEESKENSLAFALKNLNSVIAKRDELAEENRALRAELARLQRNEDCVQRLIVWATENGWNGVDNSKILDVFIIGLFDALRAHVERATEVIEKVKRMYDHPTGADANWGSLLCANAIAKTAVNEFVAATPAQSLASVKASALREVAEKLNGEGHEANDYYRQWLLAEADRIKKDAANV